MALVTSRREANRIARREAIVALARDAFLDHGYAATSMSEIAALLGGSKATLWAHFPSKEALFEAVLDDLTRTFRDELIDALRPGRDPRTTLTGFSRRFVEKLLLPTSIRLNRLIVGEGGRSPEIGALFFDRGPRQVLEQVAAYLSAADARGELRVPDATFAARHLIGMLQNQQQLLLWLGTPASGPELNAYLASSVDMYLRAYAAA